MEFAPHRLNIVRKSMRCSQLTSEVSENFELREKYAATVCGEIRGTVPLGAQDRVYDIEVMPSQ